MVLTFCDIEGNEVSCVSKVTAYASMLLVVAAYMRGVHCSSQRRCRAMTLFALLAVTHAKPGGVLPVLLLPCALCFPLFPPKTGCDMTTEDKMAFVDANEAALNGDDEALSALVQVRELRAVLESHGGRSQLVTLRRLASQNGVPRRIKKESPAGSAQHKWSERPVADLLQDSVHTHQVSKLHEQTKAKLLETRCGQRRLPDVTEHAEHGLVGFLEGSVPSGPSSLASVSAASADSVQCGDAVNLKRPRVEETTSLGPEPLPPKLSGPADRNSRKRDASENQLVPPQKKQTTLHEIVKRAGVSSGVESDNQNSRYANRLFTSWWWLRDLLRAQKALKSVAAPDSVELQARFTFLLRHAQKLSYRDLSQHPLKAMIAEAKVVTQLRTSGARVRVPVEFVHYECSATLLRSCAERFHLSIAAEHEHESGDPLCATPRNVSDLAAMCRKDAAVLNVLPFGDDLLDRCDLLPSASQFWWQLALIEFDDREYWQLPIEAKSLVSLVCQSRRQRAAQQVLVSQSSDASGIVAVLVAFVERTANAAANRRFLGIDHDSRHDAVAKLVQRQIQAMRQHDVDLTQMDARVAATCCAFLERLNKPLRSKTSKYACVLSKTRSYIVTSSLPAQHDLAMHAQIGATAHTSAKHGFPELPAPIVCQLCHTGFLHTCALNQHCKTTHGGYAEYRKQVLWKFQQAGPRELQPWVKRSALQNYSFFEQFSVPGSACNDWTSRTPFAVPRQEVACVICCVKDWIENRYSVLLFQEPNGQTSWPEVRGVQESNPCEGQGQDPDVALCAKDGRLCLGPSDKVHELLNIENYKEIMPSIPFRELEASSVAHPARPERKWMLHVRRVPVLSKSAGLAKVGCPDGSSYMCRDCVSALCKHKPQMPSLALANGMWLGRQHPLFASLSPASRMLLGRGRLVMKKVFLGKGPKTETQQGLEGNTILVAQADASATAKLPCMQNMLDSMAIVFCKSLEDVTRSNFLVVNRAEYLQCAEIRKKHCPVFSDVDIDHEAAARDLPAAGVPRAFVEHAVHMPEAQYLQSVMPGPASRVKDPVTASAQEDTDVEDEDVNADEEAALDAVAEESGSAQTMIGFDPNFDPKPAQLFSALSCKMELVQKEAQRMAERALSGQAADTVPDTNRVAAEETCRRMVIDIQDVIRKLSRTNKAVLDDIACAGADEEHRGIAVPTSAPMSIFKWSTWPACFTEFFFGDASPFLPRRPVPLAAAALFRALLNREEMQYSLPDDAEKYCAAQRSRFDTPEFVCIFGDTLRRLRTMQQVRACFDRPGFEQQIAQIASASSSDFLDALLRNAGVKAADSPSESQARVRVALNHLEFSTAAVPMTNGYKMRLRHLGGAMTHWCGPLHAFCTANYADTYSPLVPALATGGAVQGQVGCEKPKMPTLQAMHQILATSPRTGMKLFVLKEELTYRFLLAIDLLRSGRWSMNSGEGLESMREDVWAASCRPGLVGCLVAAMQADEAQGRGFNHGHKKLHGPNFCRRMASLSMADLQRWNENLLGFVSTCQYESGVLTGSQFGIHLDPEPFSQKQQAQSRMDGQLEADGVTYRQKLDVTASEPFAHIAAEERAAAAERRPSLNAYRAVPLTGCELSMFPNYRLPVKLQCLEQVPEVRDEGVPLQAPEGQGQRVPCQAQEARSQGVPFHEPEAQGQSAQFAEPAALQWLPWASDGKGQVHGVLNVKGCLASTNELREDAEQWARSFSLDSRFLQHANHMHDCSATCVKHLKKVSAEAKADMLGRKKAPACRFFFYRVLELILDGAKRRFRRRGKSLVTVPHVQTSNARNELGLVQPVRLQPFRGPTSDVAQSATRCNFDFRIMLRAFLLSRDEATIELNCDLKHVAFNLQSITVRQIDELYVRDLLRSIIATHISANNTDYYITKYQCKPLEELNQVTTQYARGLERLESEMKAPQANADNLTVKQKAQKVLLRLAFSANRSSWQSATELALFIETEEHFWTTHMDMPLFLNRIWYMMMHCQRLLNGNSDQVLEALCPGSEKVSVSTVEYEIQPAAALSKDTVDHSEDDASEDSSKDDLPAVVLPRSLRVTTSRHDDWLHRGPFLQGLSLQLYVAYIDRVPKPRQSSQPSAYFFFEPHYCIATQYVQCLRNRPVIPRHCGIAMPKAERRDGEDLAAYKLMLCNTHLSCKEAGSCADPMLHKCCLTQRRSQWSFCSTWKSRKAELRNLAQKGFVKMQRAQKISVIVDTSLFRTWWPKSESQPPCTQQPRLRATMLQCLVQKHGVFTAHILDCVCCFVGICSGMHPDQLHLEEFNALHMIDVLDNMYLQKLAGAKPLQVDKRVPADSESEPDDPSSSLTNDKQTEFIGGEPQQYDEECDVEDESFANMWDRRPMVSFSPQECRDLLMHTEARKRASQPGKHREGDLCSQLEQVGGPVKELVTSAQLFADTSNLAAHQSAVIQQMRSAESAVPMAASASVTSVVMSEDAQTDARLDLMKRNAAAAGMPQCVVVELPDCMRGPCHVAWKLMQAAKMNDEQMDIVALLVEPMQKAFLGRRDKSTHLLPKCGALARMAIIGGGGCGKSTLLMKVLTPLFETFFGSMVRGAPSNKAARGVHGRTVHTLASLKPSDSLRAYALSLGKHDARKKLEAIFAPVGAVALDEFSQLPAALLHALALRAMYARSTIFGLDIHTYAEQKNLFGDVPIFLMLGDHLQLPPVPKQTSLMSDVTLPASAEHKAGCAMFANVEMVYLMEAAMRFTDPLLISILRKMRVPGGEKLTAEERQALESTSLDACRGSKDSKNAGVPVPRQAMPWRQEYETWFQSCYLWSVTTFAVYMRSQMSAASHGRVLFCCQAIDCPSKPADKCLHAEMLEEPSLSTTKRLPGFCMFHMNMRVRLTCNVAAPFVCQDTAGTIVGITFDPAEPFCRSKQEFHETPVVYLQYMPLQIFVRVDDCAIEFLPPVPCREHRLSGPSLKCQACSFFPGVLLVKPQSVTWQFSSKGASFSSAVKRTQFPLMYEKACALYSMQGVTADGLIAHLHMPARASKDIQYLIVYVLLSRVRSLEKLRTVGLNPKIFEIIESGPPSELTHSFAQVFAEKATATRKRAAAARQALGWPVSANSFAAASTARES